MVNKSGTEFFLEDNVGLPEGTVEGLDKDFFGQRIETTIVSIYKSKDGISVKKVTVIPRATAMEHKKNIINYTVV